jgi:hypothetical protein
MSRFMASLSIGDTARACVALAGQFVWGSMVANDTERQGCRNQGTGGDGGGQQPGPDQTSACRHVGSSSVDRPEADAGLDHSRRPDQDDSGGRGQQPGPDQTCACRHVGSSSVDRVEDDAGMDHGEGPD